MDVGLCVAILNGAPLGESVSAGSLRRAYQFGRGPLRNRSDLAKKIPVPVVICNHHKYPKALYQVPVFDLATSTVLPQVPPIFFVILTPSNDFATYHHDTWS